MQNHFTLTTIILTIKLVSAFAADNEIPTECPQVDPINTTIHIAHELDCSKFYVCSNGRKILMMCPLMDGAGNRLHFNPKLQVCDWPYRGGCNVSTSTTAVPTEATSVDTDNSTEWVVTTESTEANNSSEITEAITEVITESSTNKESTVTVSSGSNSTVTQATTTSASSTVQETESSSKPSESTTQEPPTSNSTETEAQPSITTQSTVQETETTSKPSESTSVTTQEPSVPSSTETEAQPSITTQSTVQETETTSRPSESTSVTTQQPSVPSSAETEAQPSVTTQSTVQGTETTSRPSESTSITTQEPPATNFTETEAQPSITTQSTVQETDPTSVTTNRPTESTTFLTSSTSQTITTNLMETTNTTITQIISTTIPTIITTDDFESNKTISTLPTPLPKCTSSVSGILYPHESDCSLFYNCDHGKLVLLSCAQGLYFDEPRQVCVWPHETNCQKSTSLNPSTTISSISTIKITTSTNISDLCPADNSNNGALYPHECVCSKFYLCTNGQLVLNQCPAGLNFDSKLNICDWPENVQCQSSSPSVSSTTAKLSTTTLSSLVETIKPVEPNSTESAKLIDQPAVSKSECPEDGSEPLLPHETNCRLYYDCKDGEKWLKECSSGLEFNPTLQFCDRPELAGCSNSESNQETTVRKIETSEAVSETSEPVDESSTSKNETSASDTCLRPCPADDPIDYTVLVEHQNCSKFCKCSHGIPYVLNCPAGLQFNSLEQTCDYPERANCNRQPAY
ncbi:mucin-5AC-like isoform X1 [Cotesia glomerata]|uniref:mucin-5AC-like isoform X1 n=1 Tax=Cotesia glomerata TaxID=32391 RepID=UPI001D0183E2|nr:mucin-5AC-like isoform X1 [Cotesia glomerata]